MVRDYIYTRLNLHDGGTYFVTVIACNGAKICVRETSGGIFVDNSPPIAGNYIKIQKHVLTLRQNNKSTNLRGNFYSNGKSKAQTHQNNR